MAVRVLRVCAAVGSCVWSFAIGTILASETEHEIFDILGGSRPCVVCGERALIAVVRCIVAGAP